MQTSLRQWSSWSKYHKFSIFFSFLTFCPDVSVLSLSLFVYEFRSNAIKKDSSFRMNLLRQCLSLFVTQWSEIGEPVLQDRKVVCSQCAWGKEIVYSKEKLLRSPPWENPPKLTIFSYLNISSWCKYVTNETLARSARTNDLYLMTSNQFKSFEKKPSNLFIKSGKSWSALYMQMVDSWLKAEENKLNNLTNLPFSH